MIRRMVSVSVAFVALFALALRSGVSCLSPPSPTSMTRRDATASLATASLFLLEPPLPAHAATDLSQYQDGPEGIQYLVLKEGSGATPQRGQPIQTSYTLWINGFPGDSPNSKQIDSSKKPILGDQPFKVRAGVSQVIRGWDLALMGMKEGEKRRLIVPPALGYGDTGVGPIPGKATLYFEMELTFMEPMRELTDDAKAWLEAHPL